MVFTNFHFGTGSLDSYIYPNMLDLTKLSELSLFTTPFINTAYSGKMLLNKFSGKFSDSPSYVIVLFWSAAEQHSPGRQETQHKQHRINGILNLNAMFPQPSSRGAKHNTGKSLGYPRRFAA